MQSFHEEANSPAWGDEQTLQPVLIALQEAEKKLVAFIDQFRENGARQKTKRQGRDKPLIATSSLRLRHCANTCSKTSGTDVPEASRRAVSAPALLARREFRKKARKQVRDLQRSFEPLNPRPSG